MNEESFYYWRPMEEIVPYQRTEARSGRTVRKPLQLPLFVDDNNQLCTLDFEYYDQCGVLRNSDSNIALLVSGVASGYGTVFHNCAISVISEYHPNDVELWLVDPGKSYFSDLCEEVPPHVKYLFLEDNECAIKEFIDILSQTVDERVKMLISKHATSYSEIDLDEYMPKILVVCDLDPIMRAINECEDYYQYRDKLLSILNKSKAVGMFFFFVSRRYVQVKSFFSNFWDKIQNRLLMALAIHGIQETMEYFGCLGRSEYELEQIQKLVADDMWLGKVVFLERDNSCDSLQMKQAKMLFFPDRAEKNSKYMSYIRKLKEYYQPIEENQETSNSDSTYIDKHAIIVGAKKYYTYKEKMQDIEQAVSKLSETEDGACIVLGTSQTIPEIKAICVEENRYQNLLLVGNSHDKSYMASIIITIMNQFHALGYEIVFLPYLKSRLYKDYAESHWNPRGALQDYSEMNKKLNEIFDNLQAKKEEKVLLVLCDTKPLLEEVEIADKLSYILENGPRRGYHVLNVNCDPRDVIYNVDTKSIFGNRVYSHFMSFQIDKKIIFELDSKIREAARMVSGYSEITSGTCGYSSMEQKFTFRPFLFKSITWDGWDVDEDGNAKA